MLTIEECRKHLKDDKLSDARIQEILDYLYSFCKEVIKNNLEIYEKNIAKTNTSK